MYDDTIFETPFSPELTIDAFDALDSFLATDLDIALLHATAGHPPH
ncbi:MAG: hypothetical protein AAFQ42_04490 [Pseudomonadota bacterium]